MSFSRKWLWLALLASCIPASSNAVLHGSASIHGSQTNVNQTEFTGAFMNFLKTSQLQFSGTDTPAKTDINGYPIAALNGNYGATSLIPYGLYTTSTIWVLKWPATRPITFIFNYPKTVTNCFTTTTCTLGVQNNAVMGGGSACTTADPFWGNSCRIEFTFNSINYTEAFSAFFPAGANNYAPGSGDLVLIRKSDEAAYNAYEAAGTLGKALTPEFVSLMNGLNAKTIRPMGFNNTNNSNETNWNYRTSLSSLSYNSYVFPPNIWSSSITGSGTYTATPATDTPLSGWVDGEMMQGAWPTAPTLINITGAVNNGSGLCRLTVDSTTTLSTNQVVFISGIVGATGCNSVPPTFSTITVIDSACTGSCRIDIQGSTFGGTYSGSCCGSTVTTQTISVTGKSGGAKFLGGPNGAGLGTANTPPLTGKVVTLRYDGVLGYVIVWVDPNGAAFGVQNSVPVEHDVALANAIGADLWDTYPPMAIASYNTSRATTVLGLLNGNLNYIQEFGNENWNPGFVQFQWETNRGLAMGWSPSDRQTQRGWQSYASLQLFSNVATAWAGQTSRLKGIIGVQYCCQDTGYNSDLLQSATLNGNTYPSYCALVGGTWNAGVCTGDPFLYYQAGNRLADKAKILAGAPYYAGAAIKPNGYAGQTAYNIALLQTMAVDYNSGGSGITTALNLVDADIRSGTLDSQTVTFSGATATITGTDTFSNGTVVSFTSSGTLPTGIVANVPYFVINNNAGAKTFQIAAYPTGSAITPSGGSGTLSVGNNIAMSSLVATFYGSNDNTLQGWQNLITANGYNLTIQSYEGGLEMQPPTTVECASMGLSVSHTSTITFNASSGPGTQTVNWTAHGLHNGDRVSFSNSGGALPGEINGGLDYFVTDAATNVFDIRNGYYNPNNLITPITTGTGTQTALACSGVDNLIDAYQNNALAAGVMKSQFDQFKGLDPTMPNFGKVPADTVNSEFAVSGPSFFSMCGGGIASGGLGNAQCFARYTEFGVYH